MDQHDIDDLVRRALAEDLPDITSEAIFARDDRGQASFIVKTPGVLAGLPFAAATFQAIDREGRTAMRSTLETLLPPSAAQCSRFFRASVRR